jgi:hypothetical protein
MARRAAPLAIAKWRLRSRRDAFSLQAADPLMIEWDQRRHADGPTALRGIARHERWIVDLI